MTGGLPITFSKAPTLTEPFTTLAAVGWGLPVTVSKMGLVGKSLFPTIVSDSSTNAVLPSVSALIVITTNPIPIIDNKMLLPTKPCGDILLGIALVYGLLGIEEYNNITILELSGAFYACFNEPSLVEGSGVVSYLTASGV